MRLSPSSVAVVFVVLAACDLQPPPKAAPRANPPVAEPVAAAAVAPTPPPSAPGDAGIARPPADALIEVSAACVDVGAHIATILIADAKDPSQKAALEQERTKIVRRSAEACTRDEWNAPSQKCFIDAKTSEAMQVCGKNLKSP